MNHEDSTDPAASAAISSAYTAPPDCDLIEDMLPMMDDKDNADADTSAAISSACTALQDCDLIEHMLPMLCATSISVCRRLVLQQAVKALGFSMHETTTHDDESNEILTAIQIDVPPHIRVARMKTRLFYGDWSLTTEAAIQSACFKALIYLQEVKVLTIDGIHSADLKQCRRELLRSKSWAEAFEQHADKLQLTLSRMVKEKTPVVAISQTPAKVDLIEETTDTKKCSAGQISPPSSSTPFCQEKATELADEVLQKAEDFVKTDEVVKDTVLESTTCPLPLPADRMQKSQSDSTPVCAMKQKCTGEQLLAPSGTAHVTQHVGTKEIPRGIDFASLTNKPFIFPPDLLKFLCQKRRIIRLPDPVPAHAAFNRKKRKLIIDSQRKKTPTLPSLPFLDGSSSEDISIVTDLSNEAAYAKPNHTDPECSLTALASPPSVNKPSTLRTSTGLIDSKVRKPLFQDDEDKGKAAGLGDEVLEKAGGFAETDEVVSTSSKKAKP